MKVENKASNKPIMQDNSWQELVTQPGEHDVLLGRGGGMNIHSGNIKFRQLVSEHRIRYLIASKVGKPQVAREVVKIWRGLNPRGRFLMRASDSMRGAGSVKAVDTIWYDVGDQKAREKASQCLRERTPESMSWVPEEGDLVLQYVKMQQEAREREAQRSARAIPQASPQGVQDFGQHQQVDLVKQSHVRKQLDFSGSAASPECAPAMPVSPEQTTVFRDAMVLPRQPLPFPTKHSLMNATPQKHSGPSSTGTVHTFLTPRRDLTFNQETGSTNNRVFDYPGARLNLLVEPSDMTLQHAARFAFSQEQQSHFSNVNRNEVACGQHDVRRDGGSFLNQQNWMVSNQTQPQEVWYHQKVSRQQQPSSNDNGPDIGLGLDDFVSGPLHNELAPTIPVDSDEPVEWSLEDAQLPSIQDPIAPLTLNQEVAIDSYRKQLQDYLDETENSFWVTESANNENENIGDWEREGERN